ncbi:MAG TPA: hypothetical protein VF160_07175 [Candidatus Dormibacteraeota bacterium]
MDRTLLLVHALLGAKLQDHLIDRALAGTSVVLVADASNVESHAGQSAVVITAQLLLEMGVQVQLALPDKVAIGQQPPLEGTYLRESLIAYGADVIPGSVATVGAPHSSSITVVFGDSDLPSGSVNGWRIAGSAMGATMSSLDSIAPRWRGDGVLGPGLAAVFCASEVFRRVVRALGSMVGMHPAIAEVLESSEQASFEFPWSTPRGHLGLDLGHVDVVSGGAITTAMIHLLLRSQASGSLRVYEPQVFEKSNLNRYPLFRGRDVGTLKAIHLARWSTPMLTISPEPKSFGPLTANCGTVAPTVVVGADDIGVRWFAQGLNPDLLVVGATADFMILVSRHRQAEPCARCLHPVDDGIRANIPTVSFVSYLAGLAASWFLLSTAAGQAQPGQAWAAWPLRVDLPTWQVPQSITRDPGCRLCGKVG